MVDTRQPEQSELRIVSTRADSPAALACLDAYYAELAAIFPEGFDPARSVSADVAETSPPVGAFLLIEYQGRARGCGAVKTMAPGVGEIKRMWLHAELRGRGLGRRLLSALEESARRLGHQLLRLDTAAQLDAAIGLYRAAGYREIPAYNDNPYAHHWFEKQLLRTDL